MTEKLKKIKLKFSNNAIVVENYFFMTILQVINTAFGIILYPYIIRVLGANSFGLYVFALTVTNFFISFISFGFNFPAIKTISKNKENTLVKNEVISSIFTAKIYLLLISGLIFVGLVLNIGIMRNNWIIYTICFSQIIAEVFIPTWFFQGIQKMRILTIIQISIKIISLPFYFIFIKKPEDVWIYAAISSSIMISIGIVTVIYLRINEDIKYVFVSIHSLKKYFSDALPFFWTSAVGTLKEETATLLIGTFFGMRDVAIYDLAKKIISIPRMLTLSINNALFPQIIERIDTKLIKKIIKYETLIGISVSLFVAVFGYWMVLILGGQSMLEAYPIALILSVTIYVWLVVGSYISFIFVPLNKYYYITLNQIVALGSFIFFSITGLFLYKNIIVIVLAIALSGICEILFCKYLIKSKKLL